MKFRPLVLGLAVGVSLLSTAHAAEEIRYDSGSRRDPFIALVGPEGVIKQSFNSSGLNLEGVIYDPKSGSLALINGQFYRQGDHVEQAILTRIQKDRVTLTKDEEQKILMLRDENEEEGKKKSDKKPEPANAKKK